MKPLLKLGAFLLAGYVLLASWYYFNQESIIFHPEPLPLEHRFESPHPFEEHFIEAEDGVRLHGILVKADSSRGLVFYLHGNRRALNHWIREADIFVRNGFDTFLLDYRGYGKSGGDIENEQQFLSDVEAAYARVADEYARRPIVIAGYSIGTGPAAWLASHSDPQLLILKAPYYSLPRLAGDLYPFLPSWLVAYEFRTDKYIQGLSSRIAIFHGSADRLIPIEHSRMLSQSFKPSDTLIVMQRQGHNGVSGNEQYKVSVELLLNQINFSKE